jgi:hypothetical protein
VIATLSQLRFGLLALPKGAIFGTMGKFSDWLVPKHTCDCGAVYKVTATKTPLFAADTTGCEVCAKEMPRWDPTSGFFSYELVSRPDTR